MQAQRHRGTRTQRRIQSRRSDAPYPSSPCLSVSVSLCSPPPRRAHQLGGGPLRPGCLGGSPSARAPQRTIPTQISQNEAKCHSVPPAQSRHNPPRQRAGGKTNPPNRILASKSQIWSPRHAKQTHPALRTQDWHQRLGCVLAGIFSIHSLMRAAPRVSTRLLPTGGIWPVPRRVMR
jgi:hypothetical protein